MAIDVNAANQQALQLASCADELRQAKNQLQSYRSSLSSNWQGEEVKYILQAIDQNIAKINKLIAELEDLSGDVKSAAAAIKREEDAAAEAARKKAAQEKAAKEKAAKEKAAKEKAAQEKAAKEKAQRVADAQKAYDAAKNKLTDLQKEKAKLKEKLEDTWLPWKRNDLKDEIESIEKQIEYAKKELKSCTDALNRAKG